MDLMMYALSMFRADNLENAAFWKEFLMFRQPQKTPAFFFTFYLQTSNLLSKMCHGKKEGEVNPLNYF